MQEETQSTPRAQARAQIEQDIVRIGRDHLAEHGAAALSLRAIARDLGMVSSAVYRYVRNRDELLTVLVVDAYTEMADHVQAALAADTAEDLGTPRVRRRLLVAACAIRRWAVAEPARFALLYGSPVPGYAAPAEQTSGPGTRVVAMLLTELSAITVAPTAGIDTTAMSTEFAAVAAQFGLQMNDATALAGTCLWSAVQGAVSLEVFGQYGSDTFAHPDVLFDLQLTTTLERLLP